jgi:hypothetical protein
LLDRGIDYLELISVPVSIPASVPASVSVIAPPVLTLLPPVMPIANRPVGVRIVRSLGVVVRRSGLVVVIAGLRAIVEVDVDSMTFISAGRNRRQNANDESKEKCNSQSIFGFHAILLFSLHPLKNLQTIRCLLCTSVGQAQTNEKKGLRL